jgi:hypothetical protein
VNRVKQQSELMRVAKQYRPGRGRLGVEYLQKALSRFERLADQAWKANEPALFTRYSNIAISIATGLAGYQTPRLSAVATVPVPASRVTDVHLTIFEHDRRRAIESRAIESQPDGKVIDAEPVTPPVEDKAQEQQATAPSPTPEAAPPAPKPQSDNAYGTGSGRSVFEHPSLAPWTRYGGGRCPWH